MSGLDPEKSEPLDAYERGELTSVATKAELPRIQEEARATGVKDPRLNIRLSSGDFHDLQARALQEGMPYQTLIASVLRKFVSGLLVEADDDRTGLVVRLTHRGFRIMVIKVARRRGSTHPTVVPVTEKPHDSYFGTIRS